jgi:hypothetical protein
MVLHRPVEPAPLIGNWPCVPNVPRIADGVAAVSAERSGLKMKTAPAMGYQSRLILLSFDLSWFNRCQTSQLSQNFLAAFVDYFQRARLVESTRIFPSSIQFPTAVCFPIQVV